MTPAPVCPKEERIARAEAAYRDFMLAVGLPLDEDTADTPRRVARMFVVLLLRERAAAHRQVPP